MSTPKDDETLSMPNWEEDCMHFRGRVLTGKHAHWCTEFDGLPVDETCPEWGNCTCFDDVEDDPDAPDAQNEPRTCPYCDQPRQDTFENRWRFECGTSLQQSDGKTVKQGRECKLRVTYSKLLVDWCKQKERIAELEKGIAEIQAGTRIGWFMTDLGAKCSKLLN